MVQPIIGNRYNYLVQLRKDIIKLYKFIIIILLIALHISNNSYLIQCNVNKQSFVKKLYNNLIEK